MKKAFVGLAVAALLVVAGCNQETPGGPGDTHKDKGTVLGPAEDTFKVSVPTLATHIKQGEMKSVTIGISRGKNFQEDVALKFSDMPKGVMIEGSPAIKHGDKETAVTLKAADDAAVGDFTVKVMGHPTKGSDAVAKWKITVEKK
jgi:hypothetical protein